MCRFLTLACVTIVGYAVLLQPGSAGEFEEVLAGLDRLVDALQEIVRCNRRRRVDDP